MLFKRSNLMLVVLFLLHSASVMADPPVKREPSQSPHAQSTKASPTDEASTRKQGQSERPTLKKSSAAASDRDADHGWVSAIQYAPDTGFTYTLGNMRDGKSIRVFSGVSEGHRTLTVDGKKLRIVIPQLLKNNAKQGLYEYQFGNHFTGSTHLSRKNTWEFSVERKITALHDMKVSWSENYLNSHVIVDGTFSGDAMEKPVIIPKKVISPKKIFSAWGKVNRFKNMSIDSALGQIDLQFSRPTMLLDYRQVKWRARDNIHLLHSDFSLKKGESISSTTTVRITPDFEKLARYQPIASEKDIYTSKAPIPSRHVIVPSPKKVVWGKANFQLESGARLFFDPTCESLAKQARGFFTSMFHLDLQEGSLDERWKHCLVLCNGDEIPKSVGPELEQMKKALLTAKSGGSYALRVVGNAILIAGKSKEGIRNGLMTLFQLSRHQVSASGVNYDQVDISDHPDFKKRGIYVRVHSDLDMDWSRSFVAAMAELKYNQVYLHFGQGIGVRFKSKEACYDQGSPSLSVEEFTEFVDYIKSFGMEVIPIWAAGKTMLPQAHFQKFPDLAELTINEGINWDISLEETFEYHKVILDEIIAITGSKKVHLGLDEIYHFALACRKNTGKGDLILAEYINRFTDYFAPRGITTVVYHDMLLKREDVEKPDAGHFAANGHEGSEKALDLLRNREMLVIEDWSYSANEIYSDFDYFFSKGFQVYGSSWFRYKNIRELSAYTLGRSDTFVCTYWAKPRNNRARGWDPRGNRSLKGRYKTYLFLPAMGLAGEAAWNANRRDLPYNFQHETLLLFNQRKGPAVSAQSCVPFDLSDLANRELADVVFGDGKGFIDKGRIMDLSTFPAGDQVFGGIPFLIAESKLNQARAISVTGAFTTGLPDKVRIPLQKDRYTSLVFLHTCHFDFHRGMNKNLSTKYLVTYEDGSTREIKLVNDRNTMAWAPSLTRFNPNNNDLWLAWTGTTVDGLPASIYGYQWTNPVPDKAIKSVTLQAGVNSDTSIFLIGLTGIKAETKEKQAK